MTEFADMLRRAAQLDSTGGTAANDVNVLFDEEPVSLTIFVQDARYLDNPPLSPVQYDAVRHIERVYYPKTYLLMEREFEKNKKKESLHVGTYHSWRDEPYWSKYVRMTNFATLQWGKGGGKDHICRVASMRIAYLLLCLASPQKYYGMPNQDTIHLLNVASSSGQAQQAFFTPITRVVKKGWFADKCIPRQNIISYDKSIECISGHSDAETQEGLNLLLGIADEIDAFRSKKEMVRRTQSSREPTKSAEGILDMMRSSGSTRFPEVFKNVRISFPRYLGSTIQKLTAEGRKDVAEYGDKSRHYVSGPLATWEVNPRVKGKEAFANDYREDAIMARAKYECRPARAINPYFRNSVAIDSAFRPMRQNPIDISYVAETDTKTGRVVWLPLYRFSDDFFPIEGAAYAMHADLAITGDRAGLAMAHVARWEEYTGDVEDGDGTLHTIREVRPEIKVDFVIAFTSDLTATPAREIQIRWGRQLCFELVRRGFNIQLFTFDGFQSADSMQVLEAKGINTARVSTDRTDELYRNLRDLIYEGRISIPKWVDAEDPNAKSFLLRNELLSLTRHTSGRVDHPADGSKDMADSLAGAARGAITLGGSESTQGTRRYFSNSHIEVGTTLDLPRGFQSMEVFEVGSF